MEINNMDFKRESDYEVLARIDERTKTIKETLDKYPLAGMSEQIKNIDGKVDNHIDGHKWYVVLVTAIVGAVTGIIQLVIRR